MFRRYTGTFVHVFEEHVLRAQYILRARTNF